MLMTSPDTSTVNTTHADTAARSGRGSGYCSGGAAAEVLANSALMRILLPAIRSEIRLAEQWGDRPSASLEPVAVPPEPVIEPERTSSRPAKAARPITTPRRAT